MKLRKGGRDDERTSNTKPTIKTTKKQGRGNSAETRKKGGPDGFKEGERQPADRAPIYLTIKGNSTNAGNSPGMHLQNLFRSV